MNAQKVVFWGDEANKYQHVLKTHSHRHRWEKRAPGRADLHSCFETHSRFYWREKLFLVIPWHQASGAETHSRTGRCGKFKMTNTYERALELKPILPFVDGRNNVLV